MDKYYTSSNIYSSIHIGTSFPLRICFHKLLQSVVYIDRLRAGLREGVLLGAMPSHDKLLLLVAPRASDHAGNQGLSMLPSIRFGTAAGLGWGFRQIRG